MFERLKWICAAGFVALAGAETTAQEFSALARYLPELSEADESRNTFELEIAITQAVPYRLFSLAEPARIVADFREVDWRGFDADLFEGFAYIADARAGVFRPGWTRLVLELSNPMGIESAEMRTDPVEGSARFFLTLERQSEEAFSASVGAPDAALWQAEGPAETGDEIRRQSGEGPLVVVLDPGHGGIDPGAEREGLVEADLMLQFARILQENLLRVGGFQVVLTRDSDVFVPLETRVSIARDAGADVFISLHADALAEGNASGATVYTLSETASDAASAQLAERHDRSDLLSGVDLSDQDDRIATVLMDLARRETQPRSNSLADALVEGLSQSIGRMHKRPRLTAGFSVLKAPDIPSVLIELGFMSSARDLASLQDGTWQRSAADGITEALRNWAQRDAAQADLIRQ
ncbi:N-acetylmuramoyl-L-alanine amidase [Cochlodiniinecator piscidefendens]|uniref:N-acetylmuramoyl-L-alanine amidase n=1 Tax=Cochlodiniinecator piscidefendens TaxID=2715756 RepID=UPI00140A26C5|nr:N-acetylmuramoyl-L-alanine amidase [Cochlodiniinecator piscidefendens]